MFFEHLTNQSPRKHEYFHFSEEEMLLISAGVKTLHAAIYTQPGLYWNETAKIRQIEPCRGTGFIDAQGHLQGSLDEKLDGKLFYCTSDQKWIILVTETFIRTLEEVSADEIRQACCFALFVCGLLPKAF